MNHSVALLISREGNPLASTETQAASNPGTSGCWDWYLLTTIHVTHCRGSVEFWSYLRLLHWCQSSFKALHWSRLQLSCDVRAARGFFIGHYCGFLIPLNPESLELHFALIISGLAFVCSLLAGQLEHVFSHTLFVFNATQLSWNDTANNHPSHFIGCLGPVVY
jgi:hypothetical protein